MRHEGGGFFSSQDADTRGVEGLTYTWTWDELVEIAGREVATAFGAIPDGNWEGTNVLWKPLPLETVAAEVGLSVEELGRRIDEARAVLFERRRERPQRSEERRVGK